MLKLNLQYFGHLMWRTDSCEKTLMLLRLKLGGEGDDKGRDGWVASLTQWTWVWVNSRSWWWTGMPGVLQSMGLQRVRHGWATEQTEVFTKLKMLGRNLGMRKRGGLSVDVLSWRIPETREPGGLPSMGWHRVGHDWSDLAAAAVNYSSWSLNSTPDMSQCNPGELTDMLKITTETFPTPEHAP